MKRPSEGQSLRAFLGHNRPSPGRALARPAMGFGSLVGALGKSFFCPRVQARVSPRSNHSNALNPVTFMAQRPATFLGWGEAEEPSAAVGSWVFLSSSGHLGLSFSWGDRKHTCFCWSGLPQCPGSKRRRRWPGHHALGCGHPLPHPCTRLRALPPPERPIV